jgi:serine/threonine protein phosphatase PrpC
MSLIEVINKIHLKSAGATHPGFVRDNNEDAFVTNPYKRLYVLADGMGGHLAGERASQIAVEQFAAGFDSFIPLDDHSVENFLLDNVLSTHQAIRDAAAKDEWSFGMGTTLVAGWMPADYANFWIIHVGDSRAYRLRSGMLELLTEDHTYFSQLKQAGQLPANPKDWPPRNILSQALGASEWIYPEVKQVEIYPGDRFLLCSDGLTSAMTDDELCHHLNRGVPVDQVCEKLIQTALRNGAQDNVTVIVVDAM